MSHCDRMGCIPTYSCFAGAKAKSNTISREVERKQWVEEGLKRQQCTDQGYSREENKECGVEPGDKKEDYQ